MKLARDLADVRSVFASYDLDIQRKFYTHFHAKDPSYNKKNLGNLSKIKTITALASMYDPKRGYGLGHKVRKTTAGTWKTFPNGVLGVDLKNLEKNILSVRHHNTKHKVFGLPNIKITPKYKNIILSLLAGSEPSIKGMHADEKVHLKKLIKHSHTGSVDGRLPSLPRKPREKKTSAVDDLKDKFKVMIGEISAGNTSDILKGELKGLLSQMVAMKLITQKQATNCATDYDLSD